MEQHSIIVELKKDDIVALCIYNLKRKRGRLIILALALMILLVYYLDNQINNVLIVWLISLCFVSIFNLIMYWFAKFRYIRQFKSNISFQGPIEYKVDENHFEVKTQHSSASITWQSRFDVCQNKDYIFIFHTKELASLIPKRFLDQSQLKWFDQFILNFKKIKHS